MKMKSFYFVMSCLILCLFLNCKSKDTSIEETVQRAASTDFVCSSGCPVNLVGCHCPDWCTVQITFIVSNVSLSAGSEIRLQRAAGSIGLATCATFTSAGTYYETVDGQPDQVLGEDSFGNPIWVNADIDDKTEYQLNLVGAKAGNSVDVSVNGVSYTLTSSNTQELLCFGACGD